MGSHTQTRTRRLARQAAIMSVVTASLGAGAMTPGALAAAATQRISAASGIKWTKISTNTGLGIASAGLLRTRDGRLHVVWPRIDGTTYSLHYSTVGPHAKLLNTGTIERGWPAISAYPRLVPGPGGGIRLVFTGGNGQNGSPYDLDAMYTATSTSAGRNWMLVPGSMSQSKLVPLTDTAAATESDGTPVAAWAGGSAGLAYHVGVDSAVPSNTPDSTVAISPGFALTGPVLARDRNRSVWAAWYTFANGGSGGYWAARILPTQQAKKKAPGSGGKGLADNEPFRSVAFAARVGGGVYLAYCVPTKTVGCAHLDLWKAGAAHARRVPGSGNGHAMLAAIAAAPHGHLWVLWYDTARNRIRMVKTNAAASRFGTVRSIRVPPKVDQFDGLQAEDSRGRLDVVALVMQNKAGSTPAYWDIQLAG